MAFSARHAILVLAKDHARTALWAGFSKALKIASSCIIQFKKPFYSSFFWLSFFCHFILPQVRLMKFAGAMKVMNLVKVITVMNFVKLKGVLTGVLKGRKKRG